MGCAAPRYREAMKLPVGMLLAVLCAAAATPAGAQEDVAAFYRGKQLRMVVGTGAGGGYDLFARAVARHLGNHIPGKPSLIVQNQGAAGGLLMVNQLYSLGPKDGTVIGAPVNGIPTAPLLEPAGARFDAAKLNWIGSTNRETYLAFAWHTAPVQSLVDLMRRPLIVGATAPGTTLVDFPLVTNAILGTRFKVVRGYDSTPQINVAIERGELEGNGGIGWQSVKTQTPQWISDKKITVIAQYGLQRDPELADAPTMLELAKTASDRAALTMMFARTEYGRPYFAPPDVPPARIEALRRAFDATMKDPDFIADAAQLQLELSPITGERVQALVAQLAATPPDVVARVRAALETPAQ
jgi:tripartite-type tricarboxylate transporter receptor subunit TctC